MNHFATALVSLLLLPLLEKTGRDNGTKTRLVIVGSNVHFMMKTAELEKAYSSPNVLEELSNKDYCTPA